MGVGLIAVGALALVMDGEAKSRPANVSIGNAVAPLKISGCLMNLQNRCIDSQTIPYAFPKGDFTGLAHGMTRSPPPASRRENRVCSVVLDARGNTVLEAGRAATRCKLNPPLPPKKIVRVFTQPVAGPGCSSYWYMQNDTGAPVRLKLKQAFWNGSQPGCGSPQQGNPDIEQQDWTAPPGRTPMKCGYTPTDASHSCSWHTQFTCTIGSNGFCEGQ